MTEIINTPQTAIVPHEQAATPAMLLQMAVQSGADLEKLEKLMDMQERWEASQAKKAFVAAMTAFKAEPLDIFKRKTVEFSGTKYTHAELSDITDVVCPALAKHGLSHRWDVKQSGNEIAVDCIITHQLGHFEKVSMIGAPDDSGKKNKIQQIASTVTYLQRYTLLSATGMSTKGMDDDGQGSGGEEDRAKLDWVMKARQAQTVDELKAISNEGRVHFKTSKDRNGYGLFVAAVQDRGAELKEPTSE